MTKTATMAAVITMFRSISMTTLVAPMVALLLLVMPMAGSRSHVSDRAGVAPDCGAQRASCCGESAVDTSCCDDSDKEVSCCDDSDREVSCCDEGAAADTCCSIGVKEASCCGPGCTCPPGACPCAGEAPQRDDRTPAQLPTQSRPQRVELGIDVAATLRMIEVVASSTWRSGFAHAHTAVHGPCSGRAILLQSGVLTT